jgi:hypothetical protein
MADYSASGTAKSAGQIGAVVDCPDADYSLSGAVEVFLATESLFCCRNKNLGKKEVVETDGDVW